MTEKIIEGIIAIILAIIALFGGMTFIKNKKKSSTKINQKKNKSNNITQIGIQNNYKEKQGDKSDE